MRAAVIDKPGELRVGEVPDPTPRPGQVVVRVGACGVCGTDLHIVDGEFPPTPYPIVPGHEFAGEVVAVAPDVDYVREGQRVAVDPSLFCGHCSYCRVGRGNLCENWNATGDTVDGAFAEYVAVPAANCYALPDSLTLRQGAMVEPLSCTVHGLNRLSVRVGDRALVIGAGTMGLLLAQLLSRAGAGPVAVADRQSARLSLAGRLGAGPVSTSVEELAEASDGGFDVVVDATGAVPAIEAGLRAVRRGGTFLVFGVSAGDARAAFSPFRVYNDEISIIGSMAVLHSFGRALALLASGAVDVDPLMTHGLPLDGYPQAIEIVRRGEGVKVQLLPQSSAS